MLIDDLQKTIKQLKQLDVLETAIQDAEKKAQNDSTYSVLVSDFWVSMKKMSYAIKELGFSPADESIQLATDIIEKLESIISTGVVDEEILMTTRLQINRKLTPGLTKEWKTFHQKKTTNVVAKMETIGSLVQDQNKIVSIQTNISNASDWAGLSLKDNGADSRLELLKRGIEEIDQIEENLNLSDEVKNFVVAVTRGKAKATDITPNIIDWISKSNLQDKFVINFKNPCINKLT